MYVCMHVRTYVYVCMYVCMYVRMYVCASTKNVLGGPSGAGRRSKHIGSSDLEHDCCEINGNNYTQFWNISVKEYKWESFTRRSNLIGSNDLEPNCCGMNNNKYTEFRSICNQNIIGNLV